MFGIIFFCSSKFVRIVNKHAIRLKTIIEDLLSLSSIEKDSDSKGIEKKMTSINSLVNTVISLCQSRASEKKVKIVFEETNIQATINAPLIEQALINLIDNAISYSPVSSEVKVRAYQVGDNLYIEVQDSGIGIAKEHHDRLFERFYSVDKARSRELGGSGLGLSIVKHIALTHNGSVAVKSELKRGSVFTIILPV